MNQLQHQVDSLQDVRHLIDERNDELKKIARTYEKSPRRVEVQSQPVYDYPPGYYNQDRRRNQVTVVPVPYGINNNRRQRQSLTDTIFVKDTVWMQPRRDTIQENIAAAVNRRPDSSLNYITAARPNTDTSAQSFAATAPAADLKALPTIKIYFSLNSATISQRYYDDLDFIATQLSQHRDYNVSISGYTDNSGAANYNLALSKKRAEAVTSYLSRKGVEENQISTHFYGEKEMVSGNSQLENKVLSRRVEIKFMTGSSQ